MVKKKRPVGLRFRFLSTMFVILLLVALALSLAVLWEERESLTKALIMKGQSLAATVAKLSKEPVITKDYIKLDGIVNDVATDGDIIYVMIRDERGAVLTSQYASVNYRFPGIKATLSGLARDMELPDIIAAIKDRHPVLELSLPIAIEDKPIGRVTIGLSRTPVNEQLIRTTLFIIAVNFVAAFILGVCFYRVSRKILFDPLEELAKAAERFATGELTVRVEGTSSGEMQALIDEFNRMATELQKAGEMQAAYRSSLEAAVARQTEDLQAANKQLRVELAERRQAEAALLASDERYRSVADNIMLGISLISPQMEILKMNRQMHTWFPRIDETTKPVCYEAFNDPPRTDPCSYCPTRWTLQDGMVHEAVTETPVGGAILNYRIVSSPIRGPGGEIVAAVEIMEDVTLQKQAADALRKAKDSLEEEVARRTEELQEANQRLEEWTCTLERRNREATVLTGMGNFLQSCLDVEEVYKVVANATERLFPAGPGALFIYNASYNRLEPAAVWGPWLAAPAPFGPNDCWSLRRGQLHAVMSGKLHQGTLCSHNSIKKEQAGSLCVPMTVRGETLGVFHLLLLPPGEGYTEEEKQLALNLADQAALALANLRLREKLQDLSVRDFLTGLFNRRYMEETLEREMRRSERQGSSLGIVMLDIDHFKRFNDIHGHDAGDAVLRELGVFLRRSIRASDVACRYGGEEFILILPEVNREDAMQRAEYLRAEVKTLLIEKENRSLGVITLSLGVAVFPEQGTTVDDIIGLVDAALYRAKREGRDRVCLALAEDSGNAQLPT